MDALKNLDPLVITNELLECHALATLFFGNGGASWTNTSRWLSVVSHCDWDGVECSNGSVNELDLSHRGLTGSIPSEVKRLTNLVSLSFGHHQKHDSRRCCENDNYDWSWNCSFGGCEKNTNTLTGLIPTEIGELTSLVFVDFSDNLIGGQIPTEIGKLSKMERLLLSENRLATTLPSELGKMTMMTYLEMTDNELKGSIPSELMGLTLLQELSLGRNYLTGSIPTEIGKLKNLEQVEMGNNDLDGKIPSEIGNLTALSWLMLDSNKLSGAIPLELGKIPLLWLHLNTNDFSSSFPDTFEYADLKGFTLYDNRVTGKLPFGFCASTSYVEVDCDKIDCGCAFCCCWNWSWTSNPTPTLTYDMNPPPTPLT